MSYDLREHDTPPILVSVFDSFFRVVSTFSGNLEENFLYGFSLRNGKRQTANQPLLTFSDFI